MNLPNRITIIRIILSILLLILLMFPFETIGINIPIYQIGGKVNISLDYIIGGIIFIVASITDFLDGNIARKKNLVTDFGKVMDAIADKILVNGVLIILASSNVISVSIPVIIVLRDIFVDSIKMVCGSKGNAIGASILGKIKTICMMVGIVLTFFSNIPFEFISIDVATGLIYIATILSVISGIEYYLVNKEYLKDK